MSTVLLKRSVMLSLSLALATMATGCSQQASDSGSPQVSEASHEGHDEGEQTEGDGHDHGGWWCGEHGIPEEVCSMCSAKAAADFKAKGDWCEEHNRAESQCFICEPSRAEKFAKLYVAKVGHEPPKLEEAEE